MACDGFSKLRGCGDCIYNINSILITTELTIDTLVKLSSHIVNSKKFSVNYNPKNKLKSLDICCNGKIYINSTIKNQPLNYLYAMSAYKNLLYSWYTSNKSTYNPYIVDLVEHAIMKLDQKISCSKLRHLSVQLTNDILADKLSSVTVDSENVDEGIAM